MRLLYPIVILFQLFLPSVGHSQDTLKVGESFSNIDFTTFQKRMYVHFREFTDGRKIPHSIKEISISPKDEHLEIKQIEFSNTDTKSLVTIVEPTTLNTLSHLRITSEKKESFIFEENVIVGDNKDTTSSNHDFHIDLPFPTFNFEIDFIILEAIDWDRKSEVVLSFYHPSGKSNPMYYTFTKQGSEILTMVDGNQIDTWIISTDYNGQPPATFWISKKSHKIIRNETNAMNLAGFKFIKQCISIDL